MSPAASTPSWTEYRLVPIWTSATSGSASTFDSPSTVVADPDGPSDSRA